MNLKDQIKDLNRDKKILKLVVQEMSKIYTNLEEQNNRLISLSKEVLVTLRHSECEDCDLSCTECENYILEKNLEKILEKPIDEIMGK